MKLIELLNLRKNKFKDYASGEVKESGSASDNSDIFECTPTKVIKNEVGIFTNAPAAPVISSVVEQDDKVLISIDVTVVKADRVHARKIELFNRIDGGEWGLISEVNLDELGGNSSFDVLDVTYEKVSTIDYQAFAVNGSSRSSAASGSINLGYTAPDVTDLNIKCGVDSFALKWGNPETRLMKAVVVKVQVLADENGNWDEDQAVECYKGFTDHFTYKILEAELDKWHVFWVSCEV